MKPNDENGSLPPDQRPFRILIIFWFRSPSVIATVHDYVTINASGWLVRIVECVRGNVDLQVRYRPAIDFARHDALAGEDLARHLG